MIGLRASAPVDPAWPTCLPTLEVWWAKDWGRAARPARPPQAPRPRVTAPSGPLGPGGVVTIAFKGSRLSGARMGARPLPRDALALSNALTIKRRFATRDSPGSEVPRARVHLDPAWPWPTYLPDFPVTSYPLASAAVLLYLERRSAWSRGGIRARRTCPGRVGSRFSVPPWLGIQNAVRFSDAPPGEPSRSPGMRPPFTI